MIRAVIFDLGGTLIEYAGEFRTWPELEEPGLNAAYAILDEHGQKLPKIEDFRTKAYEILPGRWREATDGKKNLTVADLILDTLNQLSIQSPPGQILDAAAAHYERAVCDGAVAVPHGRKTLAELSANGYALGLISNTMFSGGAHLQDLERFRLHNYFDSLLFSADVNKWKPNRAPFHHVMSALRSTPESTVFVGDDPGADVVGARRAGMHVVHFKSSDRFPASSGDSPDAVIDDLRQLTSVVRYMNGAIPGGRHK